MMGEVLKINSTLTDMFLGSDETTNNDDGCFKKKKTRKNINREREY